MDWEEGPEGPVHVSSNEITQCKQAHDMQLIQLARLEGYGATGCALQLLGSWHSSLSATRPLSGSGPNVGPARKDEGVSRKQYVCLSVAAVAQAWSNISRHPTAERALSWQSSSAD